MSLVRFRLWAPFAGLAHLVERHLAKVEVASSSLVGRSILWKFSSAGRASALQAEGHRFEPCRSHLTNSFISYADVAQLAEQLICNQQVIGSSPIIGFEISALRLI